MALALATWRMPGVPTSQKPIPHLRALSWTPFSIYLTPLSSSQPQPRPLSLSAEPGSVLGGYPESPEPLAGIPEKERGPLNVGKKAWQTDSISGKG